MKILAIDPAPTESAYVLLDPITLEILDKAIIENYKLVNRADLGFSIIRTFDDPNFYIELAIERVKSFGQVAGNSLFETAEWVGRFDQAFYGTTRLIPRMDVKIFMCGSVNSNDSTVRKAVIDRYVENEVLELGGGKNPIVGTKTKPGPLYGIKTHLWQALAVGLTHIDQRDVPF